MERGEWIEGFKFRRSRRGRGRMLESKETERRMSGGLNATCPSLPQHTTLSQQTKKPHSQPHGGVHTYVSLLLPCRRDPYYPCHRMERRFPQKKSCGVVPMLGFVLEVFPPNRLRPAAGGKPGNVTSTSKKSSHLPTRGWYGKENFLFLTW